MSAAVAGCPYCGEDPTLVVYNPRRRVSLFSFVCKNQKCQVMPVGEYAETELAAALLWNEARDELA